MEPGVFEIIFSTRAMRRLKPDPVPDALIEGILRAGQAAPNGGNSQEWGVLVIKDASVKERVQVYYQRAFDNFVAQTYDARLAAMPPGEERDKLARQIDAVAGLTRDFHKVPVWLVPCLKIGSRGASPMTGASI